SGRRCPYRLGAGGVQKPLSLYGKSGAQGKLIINKKKDVDRVGGHQDNTRHFGGVPERPKGSDCKSDAKASLVRIQPPPPSFQITTGFVVGASRKRGFY